MVLSKLQSQAAESLEILYPLVNPLEMFCPLVNPSVTLNY